MKKLLVAAAAVSLLAVAAPASAAVYGSLGYETVSVGDVDLGGVTGRLGWSSGGWWGLEAEASFGINDDDSGSTNYDLQSDFAAYVTAGVPLNEQFSVFARLGYGTTKIDVTPGSSGSADGMAYGVGAQWNFTANDGVRLDWTQRDTDDDFGEKTDVWSISYVRKFQ